MLPDKTQHKSTTTAKFRKDLMALAEGLDKPTYLEVGYDVGYTLMAVSKAFHKCVGLDNNPERFKDATNLQKSIGDDAKNVMLILGTLEALQSGPYEVVFVDADHRYECVKRDWELVLEKNTASRYVVVFHDYGLVQSGIKRFIQETFDREQVSFLGEEKDWNPLGDPTNDWEAVMVELTAVAGDTDG